MEVLQEKDFFFKFILEFGKETILHLELHFLIFQFGTICNESFWFFDFLRQLHQQQSVSVDHYIWAGKCLSFSSISWIFGGRHEVFQNLCAFIQKFYLPFFHKFSISFLLWPLVQRWTLYLIVIPFYRLRYLSLLLQKVQACWSHGFQLGFCITFLLVFKFRIFSGRVDYPITFLTPLVGTVSQAMFLIWKWIFLPKNQSRDRQDQQGW